MRKILIRAGISPLEQSDPDDMLINNRIGTNSGNLIYQYSVFRTLMTEGTQFVARYFDATNSSDEFIEQVNSQFDCVILPLANAFRANFDLKSLTAFVNRMKIPCAVIGIGLQADNAAQIQKGFPYDEDAKAFVSAILEHSAMLGLRGELTGEYLKKLGFAPERHFTVTGCPSLYSRGIRLPEVRLRPMDAGMRISVNTRLRQATHLQWLLNRAIHDFPDYHLVFQKREELALLRYGVPIIDNSLPGRNGNGYYPRTELHPAVRGGHAVGFVNARAWHRYMEDIDFSFGSRIHGNIAAVVSGTPAFVFTTDTRTEELCRYHQIPHMPASQVKPEQNIRDIYEKTDFNSVHAGHEQRFRHFVDFLNANGLDHIYRESLTPEDVPFDRAIAELPEWGRVQYQRPISLAQRRMGAFAWQSIGRKVKAKLRKGRRG